MKRLMFVKMLVIMVAIMAIFTACVPIQQAVKENPEAVREAAVNAVVFIGKTLPYVVAAMNKDVAPPYDVLEMDTISDADGRTITKGVWPEWRLYHFDGFDALVEVGGKDDGKILGITQAK